MHFSRLLIVLASVLGIGTAYLPWRSETLLGITTKTAGVDTPLLLNAMQLGDGWIAAVCFGLIIVLVVVGRRWKPIGAGKKGAIVVLSGLIVLAVLYDFLKMQKQSVNVPGSLLSTQVAASIGLYLCGAIAIFIALLTLAGKVEKYQQPKSKQHENEI